MHSAAAHAVSRIVGTPERGKKLVDRKNDADSELLLVLKRL
jgi:hypothetical protein